MVLEEVSVDVDVPPRVCVETETHIVLVWEECLDNDHASKKIQFFEINI